MQNMKINVKDIDIKQFICCVANFIGIKKTKEIYQFYLNLLKTNKDKLND